MTHVLGLPEYMVEMLRWRRQLYSGSEFFRDVQELIDDALRGGPARWLVEYALQLRVKGQNRKTWAEFCAQTQSHGVRAHWYRGFIGAVWLLYQTEMNLCRQRRTTLPSSSAAGLSRSQRELLSGTGMVQVRRPLRSKIRGRMMDQLNALLEERMPIFWADNYSKFMYRRNPEGDREAHIRGTALAILPAKPCSLWTGPPTLGDMVSRIDTVVDVITRGNVAFINEVRTLQQRGLTYDGVRVPADIRRHGVTAAPWHPLDIKPLEIGSSEGLVGVLEFLMREQKRRGGVAPILGDVNVYYRILRCMYSVNYSECDVQAALKNHPLLFGVWHGYAHCLRRLYAIFRPWWCALEYLTFLDDPEDCVIYDHPKLITLEHMLMAIFLNQSAIQKAISTFRRAGRINEACLVNSHADRQLQMLELLCCEYVPALVELAIQVRHAYWVERSAGSGVLAQQLMARYLIFLTALDPAGSFEYPKSLCLGLLQWSRFHAELPAFCYVEECLEASLSRLSRNASSGFHFDTAADLGAVYCGLGPASQAVHNVNKPGISRVFVHKVFFRVERVLEAIATGSLPCVVKDAKHKSRGTMDWPSKLQRVPDRILVASQADFRGILLRTLVLLSKGPEVLGVAAGRQLTLLENVVCQDATPPTMRQHRAYTDVVQSLEKEYKSHMKERKAKRRRVEVAVAEQAVEPAPVMPPPPARTSSCGDLSQSTQQSASDTESAATTDPDGMSSRTSSMYSADSRSSCSTEVSTSSSSEFTVEPGDTSGEENGLHDSDFEELYDRYEPPP